MFPWPHMRLETVAALLLPCYLIYTLLRYPKDFFSPHHISILACRGSHFFSLICTFRHGVGLLSDYESWSAAVCDARCTDNIHLSSLFRLGGCFLFCFCGLTKGGAVAFPCPRLWVLYDIRISALCLLVGCSHWRRVYGLSCSPTRSDVKLGHGRKKEWGVG